MQRAHGSDRGLRPDLFVRSRSLIKAIPKPEKTTAKEFGPAAEELFDRIMQMTDNAGATDGDRALNYLAVRYLGIYATPPKPLARNDSLTAVDVPRRL